MEGPTPVRLSLVIIRIKSNRCEGLVDLKGPRVIPRREYVSTTNLDNSIFSSLHFAGFELCKSNLPRMIDTATLPWYTSGQRWHFKLQEGSAVSILC